MKSSETPKRSVTDCTRLALRLQDALTRDDGEESRKITMELTEAFYPFLVKNAYKHRGIGKKLELDISDPLLFEGDGDPEFHPLPSEICTLVNEGWKRIWENLSQYDPEKGPFENWAIVVAYHWWIDLFKHEMRSLAHIDGRVDIEALSTGYPVEKISEMLDDLKIRDQQGELSKHQKKYYKKLLHLYHERLLANGRVP